MPPDATYGPAPPGAGAFFMDIPQGRGPRTALHSPLVKVLALILAAFLIAIQGQLWFGKGGLARGVQLRAELRQQQQANEQAQARNALIQAELRDLREGLEMVEEKARLELSMVRPDEIYVQVHR